MINCGGLSWKIVIAANLASGALSAQSAQKAHPVIRYANTLGGSGAETPYAIATDKIGNVYITGTTDSTDFPNAKRLAPPPLTNDILGDMFIAKIDPSGANLIYSVLLGPGKPSAIIVDLNGAVYVAGSDSGRGFPTKTGTNLGNAAAFPRVMKAGRWSSATTGAANSPRAERKARSGADPRKNGSSTVSRHEQPRLIADDFGEAAGCLIPI